MFVWIWSFDTNNGLFHFIIDIENIAKGTTDPRVEFILPKSYRKFKRKSWSNFIFSILTFLTKHQLQLQNLDQPLCSKSELKFSFMTKRQLLNQQAVANMILSINISNSNNLNKFWVGIFTRQGHINQVYQTGVSQSVSELVTRVNNDRTQVR